MKHDGTLIFTNQETGLTESCKISLPIEGVDTRFDDRHPIDQWYIIVSEGDVIRVYQE